MVLSTASLSILKERSLYNYGIVHVISLTQRFKFLEKQPQIMARQEDENSCLLPRPMDKSTDRDDSDRYEDAIPRAPKRSKSMSCLSSEMLIFSKSNVVTENFSSLHDSSNQKIPNRSLGSFKRPMLPRRRVSFYVSGDGVKSKNSDKSTPFEFRPSFDSVQVSELCFSDDFLCNGAGGSLLQKSHSFCDPRLRDALTESWREML